MDPDEGLAAAPRPGLWSWVAAGVAILVAVVVLWSLASPKPFYDSWWESMKPANVDRVTAGEIERVRSKLYRVRSLQATVHGDSILVHPVLIGESEGSYTYRSELTLGTGSYAVTTHSGWIGLPDDQEKLDIRFALSELDSAFAAQQKVRPGALAYQVRVMLEPGTLVDRDAQAMLMNGKLGGHLTSSAFVARMFRGSTSGQ